MTEKTAAKTEPPSLLLQQAGQAAAANAEPEYALSPTSTDDALSLQSTATSSTLSKTASRPAESFPDLENVPPPPYDGNDYGHIKVSQMGLDTGAQVANDGRVNIKIRQRHGSLASLLVPALRNQLEIDQKEVPEPPLVIPAGLGLDAQNLPPPPMNVVIQIVGSRGDVQPFIALGQDLKKYGHRVRVATHPTFREFVTENGLEFFSIGGDPAELMAFMVKNPGLMPGFDAMRNGDIGKRRKGINEMILGCWRSCIEAGDGTGIEASDRLVDGDGFDSAISLSGGDAASKPFVADAIIANPPSFAHVHVAEKLGIPLHLMFTMPWSPTQQFPHPLANIQSTDADPNMTNFMTYALIDMMTWQGLGDVINHFRERTLGLEPISIMWAPGMASRLRIPYTYCWSPALIPKPADWGNHIDVSGFFFLNLASNYTPPDDLKAFLDAGPPPVYIGFGSIVVDDPNAMTKLIFEAVKKTGQRALVSKGWGGIGADELGIPEGVFMLGNCPHDWLFKQVSCVVHHGGAGTSAAGITSGRPTVVVPFFGDQPFWGSMIARAGAGPHPVPYKELNATKLADAIQEALKPESLARAQELSQRIHQERGAEQGAKSFHKGLQINSLRCVLYPKLAAVWRIKRTDIHISALAAQVLANEGLLSFHDLKLFRPREYDTDDGPWEPFTGAAAALIGTMGNMMMGVADFPVEMLKALRIASTEIKERRDSRPGTPTATTPRQGRSPTRQGSVTSIQDEDLAGQKAVSDPATHEPLTNDHRACLRNLSHHDTKHSKSPTRHGSTSRHDSPSRKQSSNAMNLESMIDGTKGVSKIVTAGVKSPMDFTMALAQGFHNAPKLYGDDTVRKQGKITGVGSGLKAAGREFQYGFFDGITGLVTQPLKGAEKEGPAGFVKGAAKGMAGLILKPAAGIWGLPGYTTKGVYAEIKKHFGSSVQNYIIAARTSQGYAEWKESTQEQRDFIIAAFRQRQDEIRKKGGTSKKETPKKDAQKDAPKKESKKKSKHDEKTTEPKHEEPHHQRQMSGDFMAHFRQTRHMSWDERKKFADEKKTSKFANRKPSAQAMPVTEEDPETDNDNHLQPTDNIPHGTDEEFENAITRSVTATSRGNPEEDAAVERAIRASLKELRTQQVLSPIESAETRSMADESAILSPADTGDGEDEHDHELNEAVRRSLAPTSPLARGNRTDSDEDLKRAIEESKLSHKATATEQQEQQSTQTPAAGGAHGAGAGNDDNGDDKDLKLALAESNKYHQQSQREKAEKLEKERREEEVVLEYIKKQSLLEEEHRRKLGEGKS